MSQCRYNEKMKCHNESLMDSDWLGMDGTPSWEYQEAWCANCLRALACQGLYWGLCEIISVLKGEK